MCNSKKIANKLIIISAPSGSGKTTIVNFLLKEILSLNLSVSVTTRPLRDGEKNGEEYYFLTTEEFKKKIKENLFIEYNEVYPNHFYGTLKAEVYNKLQKGKNIILNLDITGGLNIKKIYKENVLLIFLMPPSLKVLKERLKIRKTESSEIIKSRLCKAANEIRLAVQYDLIILNDNLDKLKKESIQIVSEFITKK